MSAAAAATATPPAGQPTGLARLAELRDAHRRVREEIAKVVIGQDAVVADVLASFFAGGHCLLTGVPGLAKTLLISTLGAVMDLRFRRIQFTPDLMPSDIIGHELLREGAQGRTLEFMPGPIFSQIVLADEINRTPPKTQAALLEAMQERQVTSGGVSRPLEAPFFVLATQNPIEQEGTYPLPLAQQDRFLFSLRIGYPTPEEEARILDATTAGAGARPRALLGAQQLLGAQRLVRALPVAEPVARYIARLVAASRPDDPQAPELVREMVSIGASLRGAQGLLLAARARAALDGRLTVAVEDVRAMAPAVLRHRIVVNFRADAARMDSDAIIAHLLEQVEPPRAEA
jgi:MoxR-like ATPase